MNTSAYEWQMQGRGVPAGMNKISRIFLQAVAAGLERKEIEDPGFTTEEWRKLMDLSNEHMLLPVVFEAVYGSMPEDMEKEYRAVSLTLISGQVRRSDAFLKIYRRLTELGIEPLVFKGIICRDSYMLSDWRLSSDEDIYIDRDQFMRFHALMKELGFQGADPNFSSEHEIAYRKKDLLIEGHWELFPQENQVMEQLNTLTGGILNRTVYLTIEGTKILSMEPTDHMIFLLLHAMKHLVSSGVGIRQICDIVQWDKKHKIDWARVRTSMALFGGIRFTEAVLDAGNRFFDMTVPEGWERTDSADLIEDSLTGGVFGHSGQERLHSSSITMADTERHNMGYSIFRAVFPSREAMEINYPWVRKNAALLPLSWGVRLARYLAKIGKNNSPIRSLQIGRQRMKLLEKYGVFRGTSRTDSEI